MDYFSKWVEAYALPNQEASTVADAVVKEWICRYGVPLELHSDQGRNFESKLFQEVCMVLNIRKTRTTALHPQSDGMVERMNRTINRYLSKVVSDHQRDWDRYLHLFLLAYRSSVHETTGQTPSSIVMGRELRLPCDLKFGCPASEDLAEEDYVTELRRKMDEIHCRARSNIQSSSNRMKEAYNVGANHGRFKAGDLVWLYNPRRSRGLSPKLQSSWDGPYEVINPINDVIYRIRKLPNGKPKVIHFNRLTPYAGDQDGHQVRRMDQPTEDLSFNEFMELYSNGSRARFGVTKEEHRDLFKVPVEYSLAHCVAEDLKMTKGIAVVFKEKFGRLPELRRQQPRIGRVINLTETIGEKKRSILYLVTKQSSYHKTTYKDLWTTFIDLRRYLMSRGIRKLAVPKLECGLDGLNWRVVRTILEVIFQYSGVSILVCSFWPRGPRTEKTVDCYFHRISACGRGDQCRYRHRGSRESFRDETILRRAQCNGPAIME